MGAAQRLGLWIDKHRLLIWTPIVLIVLVYVVFAWSSYQQLQATLNSDTKLTEAIKQSQLTQHIFLWIGGLGVVLTAILSSISNIALYLQLRQDSDLENTRQREEKNRHDNLLHRQKMENTFLLISQWDQPSLLLARRHTRPHANKKDDISATDLSKLVEDNSELLDSVVLLLNYFDYVRISALHDRIHLDVFRSSLGVTASNIAERYLHWSSQRYMNHPEATSELKEFIKLMQGD